MILSQNRRQQLCDILNALNPGAVYSVTSILAPGDPGRDPDGGAILKNPVRWKKGQKGFPETLATVFALAELRCLMQRQTGNLTKGINFIFRCVSEEL